MGFFKRLFGGANQPDPPMPLEPAPPPPAQLPAATTAVEVDAQSATRRELVRMLTRDSLRFSGIPDGWVESQVLFELVRPGQACIHLRLVVRHWDERLLQYAAAFQRRLRSEIERFEPGAREWLLSIAWQYDVDDQCPFLIMPDPASWGGTGTTSAPAVESAASQEEDEMQADLARLFEVRDAHLAESVWDPANPASLPPAATASGSASGATRGSPRP